jgi:anhydro-N-acetylmuramic acid kinase
VRSVGLMSGTSLDGVDAALLDIVPGAASYTVRVLRARTVPFSAELGARVRAALPPAAPSPAAVLALDADLGAALGDAALAIADRAAVDFVASHGLTLFHDPDAARTWQIGDPFVIRERCAATVLYDFRRADCAAGGQGAPLVPFADALLLRCERRFRVALNLGGIANLTLLDPAKDTLDVVAWDVGPANMALDAFVRRRSAGRAACDRDGAYARAGRVDDRALRALLSDSYFALPPPKTTGRERFGDAFLDEHNAALAPLSLEDGCATLVALTAQTVAAAVARTAPPGAEVVVSGGGARNPALLDALRARLPGIDVSTSAAYGIDPDFKEAIAFALLGYELLRGRPAGIPGVTGARGAALLGAIAPQHLDALLRKRDEELAAAAEQR